MTGRPVSDPRTGLPGKGVSVFAARFLTISDSFLHRRTLLVPGWKAASDGFKGQIKCVSYVRDGAVETAQHQYFQDLAIVVVLSKPIEFCSIEGRPRMQSIYGHDQGLLRVIPAWSSRAGMAGGIDLFVCKASVFCERRDVNTPLIFAICLSRRTIDDDLPISQRKWPPVKQ
jgi:hypothetical protein